MLSSSPISLSRFTLSPSAVCTHPKMPPESLPAEGTVTEPRSWLTYYIFTALFIFKEMSRLIPQLIIKLLLIVSFLCSLFFYLQIEIKPERASQNNEKIRSGLFWYTARSVVYFPDHWGWIGLSLLHGNVFAFMCDTHVKNWMQLKIADSCKEQTHFSE